MATYAIGDIHGCYRTLMHLLEKIAFNDQTDHLWTTGDLVCRGPDSIAVLSYISSLKHSVTVLGNHDLHLLALAHNKTFHPDAQLLEILQNPQAGPLIEWLHQQPLIHYDKSHNTLMVHAALHPAWSRTTALRLADDVAAHIQDPTQRRAYFDHLFGNTPNHWKDSLHGWDRLRCITNILVRMRYMAPDGRLDFTCTVAIGEQPKPLLPWFDIPHQRDDMPLVIFGHWASLQGQVESAALQALDGGCVWGNQLIALRLEDRQRFSVPYSEQIK